jgi:hypothetical protein
VQSCPVIPFSDSVSTCARRLIMPEDLPLNISGLNTLVPKMT